VTDSHGASSIRAIAVAVDDGPPVVEIAAPSTSTQWKVGDVLSFSGSATDAEDGALPPSALKWTAIVQHCSTPDDCHAHPLQTWTGTASGSFTAPDHEYPAFLELVLEATDSAGLTATKKIALQPKTVKLSFKSSPTGRTLVVGSKEQVAPFDRTVIVGSQNSLSAPSPQTSGGTTHVFSKWSDALAQAHDVKAPATAKTYTATYVACHALCTAGTKLAAACDPCVAQVCQADPYCCSTSWDATCVGEVASVCGQSCGGGGGCAHDKCVTGGKLTASCDPCVAQICQVDAYCCSTAWDSTCKGEVASVCGATCP
jgi:hypothetical protein